MMRRDRLGCILKLKPEGLAPRLHVDRTLPTHSWIQHHGQWQLPQGQTFGEAQVGSGPHKLPVLCQSVAAEQSLICKVQVPSLLFCYQILFCQVYLFLGTAANSFWDEADLNVMTVEP